MSEKQKDSCKGRQMQVRRKNSHLHMDCVREEEAINERKEDGNERRGSPKILRIKIMHV